MNDNSHPKLEKGKTESEMTLTNFKLKEALYSVMCSSSSATL